MVAGPVGGDAGTCSASGVASKSTFCATYAVSAAKPMPGSSARWKPCMRAKLLILINT